MVLNRSWSSYMFYDSFCELYYRILSVYFMCYFFMHLVNYTMWNRDVNFLLRLVIFAIYNVFLTHCIFSRAILIKTSKIYASLRTERLRQYVNPQSLSTPLTTRNENNKYTDHFEIVFILNTYFFLTKKDWLFTENGHIRILYIF